MSISLQDIWGTIISEVNRVLNRTGNNIIGDDTAKRLHLAGVYTKEGKLANTDLFYLPEFSHNYG